MKKYKATMYVRLSNSDDLKNNEESNSIKNQKRLIEGFINKQKDIELVSVRVDDGYSGIIFERPAFNKMIEDIENGIINCVIVKDLSRFGREYIETGRYLQQMFPLYGVRFIAINDDIDTIKENCAKDSLVTSFKNLINDSYCRDISVKTRTSLEIKREKGEFLSASAKYGYLKSEENKNKLEIDEYAAQIIKDIYRMKIEGQSAKSIADKLNKAGVLSPIEYKKKKGITFSTGGFGKKNNSKWSATSIIRILTDEIYIGNLIQGKQSKINYKINKMVEKPEDEWTKVEDTHKPIIDYKTFQLVKKIMQLDTRISPDKDELYLFSGILICGDCGNRMTRKTVKVKDKSYIYYYCPTTKKQGCNGEMIREDKLIDCTFYSLKAHIRSILSLEDLLKKVNENAIYDNKINILKESIKLKEIEKEEINIYKATLYENLINGVLSKEEHKKFRDKYNLKIDEICLTLKKLNNEVEGYEVEEDKKWINYFKEYSDMKSLDRKTVITLIQSIIVENKKLVTINFNYKQEYEQKKSEVMEVQYGKKE